MTLDQANTLLLSTTMAAVAEVLDRHGLFSKVTLAQIVEDAGAIGDDATLREAASILASTIRTGSVPRLTVIDGGKPSPQQ